LAEKGVGAEQVKLANSLPPIFLHLLFRVSIALKILNIKKLL